MKILIVSGAKPWKIKLARDLVSRCFGWEVLHVAERADSIKGISNGLRLFLNKFRRYGVFGTLNQIGLFLYSVFEKDTSAREFAEFYVDSVTDAAFDSLMKDFTPDVIVNLGAGLMPNRVFTYPRLGTLNIHTGLLPEYRGVNPVVWMLASNQFREIGFSIHKIDGGIDTGELLYTSRVEPSIVLSVDTPLTITQKIFALSLDPLVNLLLQMESGSLRPAKQESLACHKPLLGWYGITHYLKAKRNIKLYGAISDKAG